MSKRGIHFEGIIAPLNTLLLVAALALVSFSLYNSIYNWETYTLKTGGMLSWGEKLQLYLAGLLLAAVAFSVLIVTPVMRRNTQERTQMDKRAQTFKTQANTDPLTGMHNRRYFERALAGYLKEFNAVGATLGLLILDLDHFKSINDNYGHDVGDIVLKEVVLRMRAISREHDIVARLGGEEFAVITPFANREQLLGVAERYRNMVEALAIKHGNIIIRPTVSIGVATNDGELDNADDLFKSADQKLYQAKNSGRNRVAA
ncbi:MAG: GGDEF domain-containing protein [Phyllobacteriaceae bacterium]|nr:GGDEF domain-containing protein [Phyllobacteriaceae bacterium]